ncbi:MAG: hypothetical protein ABL996_19755 [Micropepsaceae bacterium]
MPDRLLVVVPEPEVRPTRKLIDELAVLGWDKFVRLEGGPIRRAPGDFARRQSEKILLMAEEFDAQSIIVTKEICCDSKVLGSGNDLDVRRPTVGLLRRKIMKTELENRDLRWRKILENRLRNWVAKKADVDEWLSQFEKLGSRWVGEALLRQVDVIATDEVVNALHLPAQAMLGLRLVFSYLLDSDPASSSNRIGGTLAQIYGRNQVQDFHKALKDAAPGSCIVVCEDALWTGFELRGLLEKVVKGGEFEELAHEKDIKFRHCVVTDFGLLVCRQYLSYHHLNSIHFLLDNAQRFVKVLTKDLNETEINAQWGLSPPEFEIWLRGKVEPLVFQVEEIWRGRQGEAKILCQQIGHQLIDRYVQIQDKPWSQAVKEGFALGAERFGCAIAFAHSIPKVCLPLFWLGGRITIDSKEVDWKPLFFDARRMIYN